MSKPFQAVAFTCRMAPVGSNGLGCWSWEQGLLVGLGWSARFGRAKSPPSTLKWIPPASAASFSWLELSFCTLAELS